MSEYKITGIIYIHNIGMRDIQTDRQAERQRQKELELELENFKDFFLKCHRRPTLLTAKVLAINHG